LPDEAALVRLLQHYGTPFFEQNFLGRFWPVLGLALYMALSFNGALVAVRREARAWPMAVFPWLYFAVFAVANPLIFRWYLAPPLPFYFLLILIGLYSILTQLAGRLRWSDAAGRWLIAAPAAAFAVMSLAAWTFHPDHGAQGPAPEMAWYQLELYYADVGRSLANKVSPSTVIGAGDVGALGYFSGARILDTVGLMSPEASRYYPLSPDLYVISYAVPPKLILDYAPEYVVLLEVYGRQGLFLEPRFWASYDLVEKVDTDIYGSDGLLILQKQVEP
jgi:hypothetical protein